MIYLIDTGFKDPYFNMAFDESVLNKLSEFDRDTVFLRFFNFKPSSVSIGYHQKLSQWIKRLGEKGVKWVRRRTGGRAVIHSNDFTYSLVFHRKNPIIGGKTIESYRKISRAFMLGFEKLNIETKVKRGKKNLKKSRKEHLCFSSTSLAELKWEEKKIIGSAQYRNGDAILQQGTIMLDNPGPVFPRIPNLATVRQASGKRRSLRAVKKAIRSGFEEYFSEEAKKYENFEISRYFLKKYKSSLWNLTGSYLKPKSTKEKGNE